MHYNKVSSQELLDCIDKEADNNAGQETLNRITQRIISIVTSALISYNTALIF